MIIQRLEEHYPEWSWQCQGTRYSGINKLEPLLSCAFYDHGPYGYIEFTYHHLMLQGALTSYVNGRTWTKQDPLGMRGRLIKFACTACLEADKFHKQASKTLLSSGGKGQILKPLFYTFSTASYVYELENQGVYRVRLLTNYKTKLREADVLVVPAQLGPLNEALRAVMLALARALLRGIKT